MNVTYSFSCEINFDVQNQERKGCFCQQKVSHGGIKPIGMTLQYPLQSTLHQLIYIQRLRKLIKPILHCIVSQKNVNPFLAIFWILQIWVNNIKLNSVCWRALNLLTCTNSSTKTHKTHSHSHRPSPCELHHYAW